MFQSFFNGEGITGRQPEVVGALGCWFRRHTNVNDVTTEAIDDLYGFVETASTLACCDVDTGTA